MVYNDVREIIGHTPLLKLNHLGFDDDIEVYGKLELLNPAGSIKDRTGLYMIEEAEKRGILKEGSVIIEPTAGNTGIGLALAALNKPYQVIFVVPEKFSQEKQSIMRALGASIVHTPAEEGMMGARKKADELAGQLAHSVVLNQFKDTDNPLAHYSTTGPEIYDDLDGNIDYFVAGAGTGGSYSGIMKYFKEKNPNIKGILSDPVGSIIGGGEHAPYKIEGIGNDFIADTMNMDLVDEVIKVNDQEAFDATHLLAKKEGIIAGSSSGAALAAIFKLTKKIKKGRIVFLVPDRGERYLSEGLF